MSISSIHASPVPGMNTNSNPIVVSDDDLDALDALLVSDRADSVVAVQLVDLRHELYKGVCRGTKKIADPTFLVAKVQKQSCQKYGWVNMCACT